MTAHVFKRYCRRGGDAGVVFRAHVVARCKTCLNHCAKESFPTVATCSQGNSCMYILICNHVPRLAGTLLIWVYGGDSVATSDTGQGTKVLKLC